MSFYSAYSLKAILSRSTKEAPGLQRAREKVKGDWNMITSTTNSTIKTLMKLKQKKYRDEMKAYLVEGDHLVTEALKANQVELLISKYLK